jgi:hypothetical protein
MEDDIIIDELEAEPIQNNNPIEDLINSIQNKEYTDAEQAFNAIIGDRLQDTLDQTKMRISDQMFNSQSSDDEDLEEYEFDDDTELEADDFDEEDDKV